MPFLPKRKYNEQMKECKDNRFTLYIRIYLKRFICNTGLNRDKTALARDMHDGTVALARKCLAQRCGGKLVVVVVLGDMHGDDGLETVV